MVLLSGLLRQPARMRSTPSGNSILLDPKARSTRSCVAARHGCRLALRNRRAVGDRNLGSKRYRPSRLASGDASLHTGSTRQSRACQHFCRHPGGHPKPALRSGNHAALRPAIEGSDQPHDTRGHFLCCHNRDCDRDLLAPVAKPMVGLRVSAGLGDLVLCFDAGRKRKLQSASRMVHPLERGARLWLAPP